MAGRQLLLFSNGQRTILEALKDKLFKGDPTTMRGLFIPTAAHVYPKQDRAWLDNELAMLRDFGFSLEIFALERQSQSAVEAALKAADMVYVAGGNTYYLLEHMQKCGFSTIIKNRLQQGMIYIGSSAGAVITCPAIDFIEDMDSPEQADLTDFTGLGLIDFYLIPHIDNEMFAPAASAIAANAHRLNKPLWGLKDTQALYCHDNYIEIIE